MNCRQSDLAREVGCSQMAVSLALRGSPKVSAETKRAVQEAAERLGYRRNSFSAVLRSYRSAKSERVFQAVLAWLTNSPTRDGWIKSGFEDYRIGALRLARSLGYDLQEFWYREPGVTPARMADTLESRGITGILLPPQHEPNTVMDFPWDRFSAVRFGYSLASPKLNLVTNHQFETTGNLIEALLERGHRRIGLAIRAEQDARVCRQVCGAYLAWQLTQPVKSRVPPYVPSRWSEKKFAEWLHRYPMDALVTLEGDVLDQVRRAGLRVPADLSVGFVSIPANSTWAGMDQHPEAIGAAAARLLIGMVERGERGVPEYPRYVLIGGTFVPGGTVRDIT